MTLADMLLQDEDERLTVYDDETGKPLTRGMTLKGNPTVGIGRNLAGQGLTHEEALYLLRNDIARVKKELEQALPWYLSLSPVRQMVLQNLAFNMGINGLLKCAPTLDVIRVGDYARAADRMMKWKWYSQVKDRGKRMVQMMRENREV